MGEMDCWDHHRCGIRGNCPAHPDHGGDCWNVDGTLCSGKPKPPRSDDCGLCEFYREAHTAEASD